jgi:hypothetical protein
MGQTRTLPAICPDGDALTLAPEAEALAKAQAERATLQDPRVHRKAIGLVVHGIGEQPIGFSLEHVAEQFLPLIRARIDRQASLSVKPLDEGDPAEVFLWFRDSKQNCVWELRFLEVWWAKAFNPPSLGEFIFGLWSFALAWSSRRGTRTWGWLRRVGWIVLFGLARLLRSSVITLIAIPLILPTVVLALIGFIPGVRVTPGSKPGKAYSWLLRTVEGLQSAIVQFVLGPRGDTS